MSDADIEMKCFAGYEISSWTTEILDASTWSKQSFNCKIKNCEGLRPESKS